MNNKRFFLFCACALSMAFFGMADLGAMKRRIEIPISKTESKSIWVQQEKYLLYLGSNLSLIDIMIGEKRVLCRARETLSIEGIIIGPDIMIDAPEVKIKGVVIICDGECIIKSKNEINTGMLKLMGKGVFKINDKELKVTPSLNADGGFDDDEALKELYLKEYLTWQKKKD